MRPILGGRTPKKLSNAKSLVDATNYSSKIMCGLSQRPWNILNNDILALAPVPPLSNIYVLTRVIAFAQCYATGDRVAQLVLNRLSVFPNPQHYRIHF